MAKVQKLDLLLDLVFSAPFILFTALYSVSGPIIITVGIIVSTIRLSRVTVTLPGSVPEGHPISGLTRSFIRTILAHTLQGAVIVLGVAASAIEYQILH